MAINNHYKYLAIVDDMSFKSTKTARWLVYAKDENTLLGVIKWYGAWRAYSFFPEANTLYESNCLWDIADFVAKETQIIREGWKRRKKAVGSAV